MLQRGDEITYIGQFFQVFVYLWPVILLFSIADLSLGKECSNYRTIALISHASEVMLKILQDRLQQYVNHELQEVQAGFR